MKSRILGVDQSLVATGWAFLIAEDGRFRFKDYGLIQPRKLRGDERLVFIERSIVEIIEKHKPDICVMEGYAYVGRTQKFKRRASSLFQLGELGWAIRRVFVAKGIEYAVINPKTLKKKITGNGNASKDQMIQEGRKISGAKFGKVPQSKVDNVVDAFCLAYVTSRND